MATDHNVGWAVTRISGEAPALLREVAPSTPEIKMPPQLLRLKVNSERACTDLSRLATDFSLLIVKGKTRNAQEANWPWHGQCVSSAKMVFDSLGSFDHLNVNS